MRALLKPPDRRPPRVSRVEKSPLRHWLEPPREADEPAQSSSLGPVAPLALDPLTSRSDPVESFLVELTLPSSWQLERRGKRGPGVVVGLTRGGRAHMGLIPW
jgi:hypothetical protein